ncbi:MAG: glycosyltransferase family 2 protein [Parvibaculum sp.]|nr:glycosyltransferase family 2 protein [Parvibaculum sp.]
MKSIGMLENDIATVRDSGLFDTAWYLAQYPDVEALGLDPVEHYLWVGAQIGRNPSPTFDTRAYVAANPDVAIAGINPLVHYATIGKREGRTRGLSGAFPPPNYTSFRPLNSVLDINDIQTLLSSTTPIRADDILPAARNEAVRILEDKDAKVSVIIPTWNRRSTVARAVESALRQSIQPYQVLISDDGSDDDTVKLLSNEFHREVDSGYVKIIQNAHGGVSKARNAAMRAASGDIFAYLDSDNFWHNDHLLWMLTGMLTTPGKRCAYSALQFNDVDAGESRILYSEYNRAQLLRSNFIDLNCFVHRREMYESHGDFDETLSRLVDWDLIIRYTKEDVPAFVPIITVQYFISKDLNNITNRQSLDVNARIVQLKNAHEYIERGILSHEQIERLRVMSYAEIDVDH